MNVPLWVWLVTIAGLLALLALDLVIVDRVPHRVTVREAASWVLFYVCCALAFGAVVWVVWGGRYSGEFFAGYITEYSLSVDNLFVLVVIMSAFAVPPIHQHKVLLVGILLALVLRGVFIAAGAFVIGKFSAVFYLFGAFLVYGAYKLARSGLPDGDEEYQENAVLRALRKVLPVTDRYHGARWLTRVGGRRMLTPMFIVMVAIATTDLLFAVDSIPAIFGLTKEPFLVFTANAFALMGLRQLYFLIGGLLNKLIYLPIGLAVILAFIGVKLILEALHANSLPFVNSGEPIPVPTISIEWSLAVILTVLALTTVASLLKARCSPDTRA
ncbi:TerC family protein [Gandjariella thermophila]|uniref:Tellurium resistance protein TerC n=1 Tax=Gandjariella thermophila TaxID=1931992 RepID=A0A4D4JB60_9PSEU|nr:TerC family protein [Gandjariella thermophila]GDY31073.1 tellurium resistance protein TerC [Gandjariella thermophila]